MEIIITSAPVSASLEVFLASLIRNNPGTVLVLATGSTSVLHYCELIRMHREEGLDFSRCTGFNLDEYVGLGADYPASYRRFMQENLFSSINLPSDRIHIPDGLTPDISTHCAVSEKCTTKAGGIDAQVLVIGSDGHIGFNEPTSSLASILQMHPKVKIYLDENSVAKLARREYYRLVFENKPDWKSGY